MIERLVVFSGAKWKEKYREKKERRDAKGK
jgi:hypothetical protein